MKNLVCQCVIRATYDALIVGAVSRAVSRVLCRSIAIAALCCRVCVAALCCASLWLLCDCAALRAIVFAVDCSCLCVSLRCVQACVTAALQWGSGVARVLSVAAAAAVAGSPCWALVRRVSCDRACRSRSVALL